MIKPRDGKLWEMWNLFHLLRAGSEPFHRWGIHSTDRGLEARALRFDWGKFDTVHRLMARIAGFGDDFQEFRR